MTVYKYFIKIALRNKGIILTYIFILFFITLINGSSIAHREASFVPAELNVGVVDNSQSELSRAFMDYLGKEHNMTEMENDEEYIREQIFLEIVDAVIIIPEDFDEKVIGKEEAVTIYIDDRRVGSIQIEGQINKFLTFVNATYEKGTFDLEGVTSAFSEEIDVDLIGATGNKSNNSAIAWFEFYYNFASYVLVALYIQVMGVIISEFRDRDIENRMKIASKKFLRFNAEMYLGQLTVAAMITLVFILGSVLIKGKYIKDVGFGKYLINIIVFSISMLCLTFLINSITRNKFVINGLGTVLSLGTSFISGVMVPQRFLGEEVLAIAKFFPMYYYVRINEMNINSFLDMGYELSMQLLFAVVFLLMGLYFSKVQKRV